MKKGRWKLDFEIGIGLALVMLLVSAGFAAAATVKARPKAARYKNSLPKAALRKVPTPAKKVTPKVTPKTLPKATAPVIRKESPPSSGIPVLTAPEPTPESGFSSDY